MLFSIIIAAHNVEDYVSDCLESLKRQSFTNFEVLIIDDASTDSTLKMARQCIDNDPRFRLFRQTENKGQSAARNIGLSNADGDYILFLDSDDYYRDDALQTIAKRILDDNLEQLFFAAKTFCENRRLRRTHYENQEDRLQIEGVLTGPDLYVAFEKTGSFRPSSCLFALKRSIIEDSGLRFKEGIIHEDLLFLMQTIPLSQRTAFLNEPLYLRRIREGSTITSAYSVRNIEGLFYAAQYMRRWIRDHAEEYPHEFCDAYSKRVFDTYNIPARYMFDVSKEEVLAFRDTLDAKDRIDFDVHVLEHYHCIRDIYKEMSESYAYRIGRMFTAIPGWIKGKLIVPK